MNAYGPLLPFPAPRCQRCGRKLEQHRVRWLEPLLVEKVWMHGCEHVCADDKPADWKQAHRVTIRLANGRVLASAELRISNLSGPPSYLTALVEGQHRVFDLSSSGAEWPYRLVYTETR